MSIGRAKLAMGQGLSVWVLEALQGFGDAAFHAHHAIQFSLCLSGELMLTTRTSSVRSNAVAIASDAEHRFEGRGVIAFLFVEPESAIGRALSQSLFDTGNMADLGHRDVPVPPELAQVFDTAPVATRLIEIGSEWIGMLARGLPASKLPDERVRRVIDYVITHLEPSLNVAAQKSGIHISPSRLRHLFVEQTGLAFRTYLLWLRLNRALQAYAAGQSLTEAAHAAGFADSAHLSRIFRRNFGLPATTLERI